MHPQNCSRTIDRWKLDLVRARAFRLGFRGADLDDAQQEVLLEVIAFQFRPERANGAHEATALVALIDRRLCMAKRRQRRYQQCLDRVQQWIDADNSTAEAEQTDYEEQISRRLDVQELVATLAPEDQALCRALADGESVEAIANRLQCSWHTVKRQVDRLRTLLVEIGMDGYVH